MNTTRILTLGLVTLTTLALAGCSAPEKSPLPLAWTSPDQFDATYREAFQVIHEGESGEREVVGYLYRQSRQGDEIQWVQDRTHHRVGFYLANEHAFRLVPTRDEKGKPTFSHEDLGVQTREGAIRKLLGLSAGKVELEKLIQRGKIKTERSSSAS